MKLKEITYPTENEPYNIELLTQSNAGVKTTFGTVFLKKGIRIPEFGFSRHPFNEVSIVTKGHIEMIDENDKVIGALKPGFAVFINADEPQAGNVLEDTELIYVLNQLVG
ncbi:MAG: quercetin dioxygenase-like cupin family protein [Maribacter sp.]|jgi:quercetin dioxygenase-like cupin family protein